MLKIKMRFFKLLQLLLSLTLIFFVTACETPAGSGDKTPDNNKIEQLLIGTWAYDYGYNQDEFSNEEITFNKDKTFIARYGESDYESGTYKIVNDSVYGLSIEWHFTEYGDKNSKNKSDVTSLYKCTFDNDDTLHLDRFSRDQTKMGGVVQTFNPPRENTYHRIVNGTKELLTSGKWRVNKIGTPDCDWDEEWTFNEDGTMVDVWTDSGAVPETYNGTYEVIEMDGKNVLHHTLDWGTEKPEWWYEYKSYGPNLISVQLIESTLKGKVENADINYYYREVETETFYYHFGNASYKYMVPKADSYTLINHPWQLEYMNNRGYGTYEFVGWYDNPSFIGNKVTEVSGNTRDFYGKFNILTHYNSWQNSDGSEGHNYAVEFPVSMVVTMDKNTSVPKAGDTVSVLFEATLSDEIDGWFGMDIIDYTYGWNKIASDGRGIKTSGKKIYEVFNLKIDEKATLPQNISLYGINIYYNGDACDKIVTFSDWKFTVLDNSKSYNINYKFGDVTFTSKGNGSIDFALPKDGLYFCNWNWNFGESIEILGWYENADFSGNAVTSIPAGNTADKTYYAKINLKGRRSGDWEDNGKMNHDYHVTVPVKALVPGNEFNPKPGDTVTIYFEATLSNDLNQWAGWQLQADGLNFTDFGPIVTSDKKLSKIFTIKIDDNVTLPSVDELCFDFWYSKEAYDGIITFSDWKFVLLDETNSYNITYKFGDVSFETKGLSNTDFELPKDSNFFEHINWNIAQSTEILGWYENAEFIGNSVTSIPAGNNFSKTLYAKFNPKITKSTWTNSDGFEDHNYNTTIPVKALLPGKDFNPKAGDTISVYFEAKISHDLDGWGGLRLVDYTNGWNLIAQDWNNMKTEGNKLSKTFTINIDENAKLPSIENLCFDFGYEKEAYDGIITFSDWRFVLLDETNSYSIIYHFGNIEYEEKQLTAIEKTLPDDMLYFEKIDWNIGNNLLFGGWYDNPECTGASLSTIAANSIADGGTKDVYLNIIPKMNIWTSDTDDLFNYNTNLPAKLFLSESSINSIKNMTDTIFVNLTATVKDSPILHENGYSWFTFIDSTDWSEVANTDSKQASYSNGKINIKYKLNKIGGKKLPDPENMIFSMGFNNDFYGDRTKPIELNDITIVLLDE